MVPGPLGARSRPHPCPACDRCPSALACGALRFRGRLTLMGDTGGEVSDEDLDSDGTGPADGALQRALDAAAALDEDALMSQVVEELCFVLCPACRGVLRQDPCGAATMRATRHGPAQ